MALTALNRICGGAELVLRNAAFCAIMNKHVESPLPPAAGNAAELRMAGPLKIKER